ncbi:MAG: AAA family ATPase, partial [Nitrospinota bacterium]|nr:AAA family ATPase [Nitrospinota bacterium]
VVEGPSEVKDAVEHLRKSGAGRGALIPKDLRVRPADGSSRPVYYEGYCPPFAARPVSGSGILGNAADFVRAPAGFDSLVRRLLDGVRVVRDFDAALSLWKRGGEVGVLVTRAGEVLHPSGIASAGTLGAGPLQRRKEIEGLKIETARLREEIGRVEAAREREKENRAGLAGKLEDCLRAAREAESDLAEIRREMEGLAAGVSRLDESLEASHQELKRMAEEGDALGASMRRTREALDQIGKECTEAEARVRDGASALAEGREKVEQAAETVASQRVALAEVRARADNRTAEVQRFEERRREIRGRMDRLGKDAESDLARLEALGESDLQAHERIREIHGQREAWGTEAKDLEEAIAADQAFLRETQERARGLKDRTAALQEELEAISEGLSQLKVERDLLCQRAQISYGVDLTAAAVRPEEADLPDEERESLREEATALQDRLRRMGDVNMGALSEFEQLNERYQFLKGQQEDLVTSIQTLHDTIDRINRTTRRRFKTAFDAISETFSEVFRRLFGGGRAALFLSDESNLLETGVDIMVQPPGKKLGNILLLSAGEKALTAISLLFAIFRYNPSPFCLLDEVDATLDDHNVARFIDVLRELSLKTQFIVITHNKRTMSFADVLYGVTMIEKGVSGVMSVDLNRIRPRTDDGASGAEPDASPHAPPAAEMDADPSAEDRWADVEPIEEPDGNGRPGPAALQEVSSIESGETNGTPASGDGPDESETELSEKLPAESPLPPGG